MKWHDDAVFGDELPADHEDAPLQRVMTRLRDQALARPAPVPSAALAQRIDLGLVGERRRDVPALVLPIRPSARVVAPRVRYAIAAAVSALLLTAGLAGAGALPSALQDPIAHALDQIGLKLPGSDASSSPSSSPRSGSSTAQGKGPAGGAGGAAGGEAVQGGSETGPGDHPSGTSKAGAGSTTSTTLPTSVTVPPVTAPDGTVLVPPLTVEIPGLPPITLPGVTLPPVTLPPVTLPPVTLPPITLPPITLPPITLPPITLPPINLPEL